MITSAPPGPAPGWTRSLPSAMHTSAVGLSAARRQGHLLDHVAELVAVADRVARRVPLVDPSDVPLEEITGARHRQCRRVAGRHRDQARRERLLRQSDCSADLEPQLPRRDRAWWTSRWTSRSSAVEVVRWSWAEETSVDGVVRRGRRCRRRCRFPRSKSSSELHATAPRASERTATAAPHAAAQRMALASHDRDLGMGPPDGPPAAEGYDGNGPLSADTNGRRSHRASHQHELAGPRARKRRVDGRDWIGRREPLEPNEAVRTKTYSRARPGRATDPVICSAITGAAQGRRPGGGSGRNEAHRVRRTAARALGHRGLRYIPSSASSSAASILGSRWP